MHVRITTVTGASEIDAGLGQADGACLARPEGRAYKGAHRALKGRADTGAHGARPRARARDPRAMLYTSRATLRPIVNAPRSSGIRS